MRATRIGARLDRGAAVWLVVAAVAAASATLYLGVLGGLAPPIASPSVPWWAFAVAFLLTEAYPVHLHFRREVHSLSLSELGLVLGLFLATPGDLIAGQLFGAALALVVVRRQRPLKVAFNLAQFAFASCIALLVFHGLSGVVGVTGPLGWLVAVTAAVASGLAGVGLVTAVISLSVGALSARELPGVAAMSIVGSFASGSLAIVTVELLRANAPAAALLLIPATFCGLALRAYGAERRRHAHVEFLYRSMSAMQSAPEFRAAIRELLEAARTMLSAEFAEIILLPEDGGDGGLRSSLGPAGDELVRIAPLSEEDDLAVKITSRQEGAIVLARGRSPHVLDAYLAQNGLADGILTALRRDNRIFGVLLVGDRVGDVSTFNDDDRKLFDTFASHTGVLIENERVKEQLRHQAFHDDLTGLPNRVLFTERLRQSLARSAETGVSPTVLLLDLDDFKTINDSLGHSAGDKLLVEVAQRVRTCIRADDLAARLGGDEFGILLPHAADGVAELLSARLVEALRAPFALYGREMYIHASVGIATEGADARTADEVLANADLAMYSAKSNGKRRYALYEPQMHRRVRRRHELVAALEHAVSRNEITVYYQPVVALATGRTVAFEALVRWMHPHRGLVLPGAFVPLAEETGLMVPIGRKVLEEACRQAREWQQAFPAHAGLSMCVNLSPSELQSRHLADEIVEVLDGTGLASENLIVEITESGAMHDEVAALATLSEIRGRGVRLALDDFGTGHSSLSHLRDFPIDILKIAKPFVDRLGNAPEDTTFIDAIIRLASALELEVVAEGIERPDQEEMLRLLDCSLGQGYHFARPLDATAAELHLATSAPLTPAIPATPDRARSHIRAA